jgi:hypothetical protein
MVNNIRPREDGINKDLEVQSLHSSSTDIEDSDKFRDEEKRGSLREGDDIEAYPVVDETREEENRQNDGAVTRTSTKSSWKDPGPPPDGGRKAWIQGSSWSPGLNFAVPFFSCSMISLGRCTLDLAAHFVPSRHDPSSSNEYLGLHQLFRFAYPPFSS